MRGPLGTACAASRGTPNALTVTARGETRDADGSRDRAVRAARLVATRRELAARGCSAFPTTAFARRPSRAPTARSPRSSSGSGTSRIATYQLAPIESTNGAVLVPRRIDLTHGDLTLRLTIDDWQADARLQRALNAWRAPITI